MGSRHCTRAYTETVDPACRPNIPQQLYWHGTVRQGSVRFNFTEDESATCLFVSCSVINLCLECKSHRTSRLSHLSLCCKPRRIVLNADTLTVITVEQLELCDALMHRLIIEQDWNSQVTDSTSLKLNLIDPCRTVPCQYSTSVEGC